jgi:hypothetical protein
MGLIRKLRRILVEAFPPPDSVKLRKDPGIIGIVTSSRFRNLDTLDRQTLIENVLHTHNLSADERRRILIIVAVTPEEEAAHTAIDRT